MRQTAPSPPDLVLPPHGLAVVEPLERETISRVAWRLLPLLIIGYFCNYLDRVNVGFASLTMNKAIGLSSAAFGFGAGMFFIGYLVFELPSNLILAKVGARRWLARILFTWGIVSGLTAFVWNDWSFTGIRFLLGVAEAGFYPGIVLYLTWWFPSYYRARMVALFMMAQPLSLIIGPIVSGWLLTFDGWLGFQSWQVLFLIEAFPPIIMSIVFWKFLTDYPKDAGWLRLEQREWLQRRLDLENVQRETVRRFSLAGALANIRVWLFVVAYFGQGAVSMVVALFLPQIIRSLGVSIQLTGFVSALPYVFGGIAMLYFSLRSDSTGNRMAYAVTALVVMTVGLEACAFIGPTHPVAMTIALIIGVMGIQSFGPLFWPLPTAMLSGFAAAGGIALINSVGNVSGFVAPWIFGVIKDASGGSDHLALVVVAAAPLVGAAALLAAGHDRRQERIPPAGAGELADAAAVDSQMRFT
jgi:MFS transporter, ACS family, tartrate transporter